MRGKWTATTVLLGCLACGGAGQVRPSVRAPAVATGVASSTASLAAASPSPAEQSTVKPEPPIARADQPPANAEPAAAFVLRYACDDKYADERQCRPGKAAWRDWLAGLELAVGAPSLLEHRGGGPGGAEWNPQAALVAFVASSEPGRAKLELMVGKARPPVARFGNYDVFFIPFVSWDQAARPARAQELGAGDVSGISVVELHAAGTDGQRLDGTFAFSHGE